MPGLSLVAERGAISPSSAQRCGTTGKLGNPPTGNGGIPRLRLLEYIVHGFKGFGKADFVLTKPGGRDKQNTWEAG